jgi:hypothetical protein
MNSGPKWSLRHGAQYRRLCARAGCGAAAVATLRFESTQRQAWLVELDVNASRTQGDLCQRHAATLVLPRGWELHDERAPGSWAAVGSTDADRPPKNGTGARRVRGRRKTTVSDAPAASALPGFEQESMAEAGEATAPVEASAEPEEVVEVILEVEIVEVEADDEDEVVEEVAVEVVEEVVEEVVVAPESNGTHARAVPAQFGSGDEEDVEEELGEILDARTPLLQRAFRNAKPQTGEDNDA